MIRNLIVSVVLIGFGMMIGIFLPISPPNFDKPLIQFEGYSTYVEKKVNRLRLEFRESMVVENIEINEGNCSLNPYDTKGWVDGKPILLPLSVGMGTVIDTQTDCGVFVQLSIQTDKGVFEEPFPTD